MNATTSGTKIVRMDKTKELFLYLDANDQDEIDTARRLVRALKERGFTIHEGFYKEKDPETITPWLIDPLGSSHHGLDRIKAFIDYKMAILERQSRQMQ